MPEIKKELGQSPKVSKIKQYICAVLDEIDGTFDANELQLSKSEFSQLKKDKIAIWKDCGNYNQAQIFRASWVALHSARKVILSARRRKLLNVKDAMNSRERRGKYPTSK